MLPQKLLRSYRNFITLLENSFEILLVIEISEWHFGKSKWPPFHYFRTRIWQTQPQFFHICLSSWGERSPHEPRTHDQGPLVPGLSENTNSVRGENDLHGTRYTQSSMIFKSFLIFFFRRCFDGMITIRQLIK